MTGYIVQHYKNIIDAIKGKTLWVFDGKPVYFLIITLEEWWLFSPQITDRLRVLVTDRLSTIGIDTEVLNRIPYTLASVSEFEDVCSTMLNVGIDKYMAVKTDGEHANWRLASFNRSEFSERKPQNVPLLFEAELKRLIPQKSVKSGVT